MVAFRTLFGAVYIFENPTAQRVKVGMTINNVADRLRAVNDMWLGRKCTCQICGGRLIPFLGNVPQHVLCGARCPGGDALPLEKGVALAEMHLVNMKTDLGRLSGVEKGSVTRKIKTLERRIEMHRHQALVLGKWQLSATVYTECAEQVELLSHAILAGHLDETAPFGEVFRCSVAEAKEAVESTLSQLGLARSAGKDT